MPVAIDHIIVPSRNKAESARFYAETLGLENLGALQGTNFHAVRINKNSVLLFLDPKDAEAVRPGRHSFHFAIGVTPSEFNDWFERVKKTGIAYGSHHMTPSDMKGPGRAIGARGFGKAFYFTDPSGNLVQIETYAKARPQK